MAQEKGNLSFVWAGIALKNLAEDSATYDLGELGDTLSASDAVVHIRKNPNAVVSGVTINVVKSTEGIGTLIAAIKAGIPAPFTLNDNGMGFKGFMASANPTQVTISDSTGGLDVESYGITFKGNLQIVEA